MSQGPRAKPPTSAKAARVHVYIRILRWKGIARQRFEAGELGDREVFESWWPQILANFFLAETVRTARALKFLLHNRQN